MGSQVIHLPSRGVLSRMVLRQRLAEIIAIFERVEADELLAALPACPTARQNHLAALDLFLDAETELRDLVSEMSD